MILRIKNQNQFIREKKYFEPILIILHVVFVFISDIFDSMNYQSHHFVVVEQFVKLFWVLNSPRAKYILITSFGHDF